MVTRRPREVSSRPRLEAVSPLPRDEATPPVTKTCLVVWTVTGKTTPVCAQKCRGNLGTRSVLGNGLETLAPRDFILTVSDPLGRAAPPHTRHCTRTRTRTTPTCHLAHATALTTI